MMTCIWKERVDETQGERLSDKFLLLLRAWDEMNKVK